MPRAALFDLDDTLAESFQPPTPAVMRAFERLLTRIPLAIVSAAGFPRIERDVLSRLTPEAKVEQLFVLSNSAGECFVWQDGWSLLYDFALTDDERAQITRAIHESVEETGIEGRANHESMVLDRGVQVAYAALGLSASEEDKRAWDPDQTKRTKLKAALDKRLEGYEVLIGGATTIDITRAGINKAYGVRWLAEHLRCHPSDMLYVGDAFYDGGNDRVVIDTGVQVRPVSGPHETAEVLDELLARVDR